MKVLIIGSGGREHALAWKVKQSKQVSHIFIAPGNGGTSALGENIPLEAEAKDTKGLAEFAYRNKIDLTIVGPEVPLVAGVVDEFKKKNLRIFGPNQKAAFLEGSKVFAKELMAKFNVPTADFKIFDNPHKAVKFVEHKNCPLVIKADGLAAGKGVVVCDGRRQAIEAIEDIMLKHRFKEAGEKIVIEEKLTGQEASIIALSDGDEVLALTPSQDHKQIYEADKGPNTGGMGAYSPAPVVNKEIFNYCVDKIIKKTVLGMRKEGVPYVGVLYAGIMITGDGPKTLEFNVRFGDPETQAILPRMKSDLIDLILASIDGNLENREVEWRDESCVCVVVASGGYPGSYEKGKQISGIEKAENLNDIIIFHAGTRKENHKILTNGGRVLGVTGLGKDIKEAISRTYNAVKLISFGNMYYRKDIGFKALQKQ